MYDKYVQARMKITTSVSVLTILILLAGAAVPLQATSILYNNMPNPIPPNSPSLGYQSNQTAEFGDLIQLSGGAANLTSAVLLMSDWAKASDYPAIGPDPWAWPLTLTLYNVDNSSGTPQPGSVITTLTDTFTIPWRPEDDPVNCPKGGYQGFDGNCYSGLNFQVTFNLPAVAVPGQFIFGLAFNTETYGANPVGAPGPYISLNYSLNNTAPPQVGSRPLPDTAYWNTTTAGNYADGGAGGTGTFRQDTAWTPYSGAAEFLGTSIVTPTPEPSTIGLVCGGGIVIGWMFRRKAPRKT
jgi:hypothetical protein